VTTLEKYLAISVAALLLFLGWSLYERHAGAQQCVNTDTVKGTAAEVKNAGSEATQTIANATEDQAREQNLSAALPPAPTFGVQPSPLAPVGCPVSKARSAPAKGESAPDVRAAGTPGMVQPDWNAFVSASVQRAHDADAEITDRDVLLKNLQTLCSQEMPR
jgi:hypothetical protein